MTLHAKMTMPNFYRNCWNLNLIKNVEETVVFLTWKVFISLRFSIASFNKKCAIYFAKKPQMKINSLRKQIYWFQFILDQKSFQGYRCKSTIFARRVISNYSYSPFNSIIFVLDSTILEGCGHLPLYSTAWFPVLRPLGS